EDGAGGAIAGATVEGRSASTGVRRQSVTGPAGAYQIPMLPVGAYTVTIAKPGFRTSEYKDIEIAIGQRTIDVQLAVGAVTESVEVTAVGEAGNRTAGGGGGVLVAGEDQRDAGR